MSLNEWIFQYETWVRVAAFFFFLGLFALLEFLTPRRKLLPKRPLRWTTNIGAGFLNIIIIRLIFPLMAVDIAFLAKKNQWGVFNHIEIPYALATIAGFFILDLAIYLQHVMFHAVPLFWRFHRTHHSDVDFDVSTGQRFHPIEITLSMGIKIALVLSLGIPALAVLLFEVILNATSLFTHSNWKIPAPIDRIVRWFIVTPDMHRVHHSVYVRETDSNFGFNFSIWDRIFGTYRDQPKDGHERMTIGLHEFRESKFMKINWMLLVPFIGKATKKKKNPRE